MQSEKKEEQKMRRYEFLFEGTRDMILFFAENGEVLECNRNAYKELDYGQEELFYLQDILRACVKEEAGRIQFSEESVNRYCESTIYRKNQTCFPGQVQIELLMEDMGAYGICRIKNVLEERDAEHKLAFAKAEVEQMRKERNEMVANVTHELRTPVNGVMGLAQNLLDMDLTQEQKENVELIDRCCKNMIKIINNILDFSKIQAGKFTIEDKEFNFHRMMDEIIKMNKPAVDEKGLKLVCNVMEDIPDCLIGDELRLTQILNNLLSNAIKFTSMGQVVINVIKSMDLPDDGIELFFMVIDSGIGIGDDERDKLFKSFSQVDASITRKFGGTGLGLSIVKNLVQMMGGEINVESEKGKGSTFSFSVHLKKVQRQEAEGSKQPAENGFSFHIGSEIAEEGDSEELFRLGSEQNLKEIDSNMEKMVLCIEMENWERANTFADNIKQLVADDAKNLKRKAFRLQMTLRKGEHDPSMADYQVLKEALEEFKSSLQETQTDGR